jgi:hypothetical protein
MFAAYIDDKPLQPTSKRVRAPKFADVPQHRDGNLLCNVLSIVFVLHQQTRLEKNTFRIMAAKLFQTNRVARNSLSNKSIEFLPSHIKGPLSMGFLACCQTIVTKKLANSPKFPAEPFSSFPTKAPHVVENPPNLFVSYIVALPHPNGLRVCPILHKKPLTDYNNGDANAAQSRL